MQRRRQRKEKSCNCKKNLAQAMDEKKIMQTEIPIFLLVRSQLLFASKSFGNQQIFSSPPPPPFPSPTLQKKIPYHSGPGILLYYNLWPFICRFFLYFRLIAVPWFCHSIIYTPPFLPSCRGFVSARSNPQCLLIISHSLKPADTHEGFSPGARSRVNLHDLVHTICPGSLLPNI